MGGEGTGGAIHTANTPGLGAKPGREEAAWWPQQLGLGLTCPAECPQNVESGVEMDGGKATHYILHGSLGSAEGVDKGWRVAIHRSDGRTGRQVPMSRVPIASVELGGF